MFAESKKNNGDLTQYGYEVPGLSLLRYLKGTMLLDSTKDMSMHVSTCTIYDFCALAPVMWKL
jgi:hypothetical protein